ncbi:MAG TPA: DUF296 domain-containing protein [Thermoplasmata archaeon]|nr:DUF296 domain-containing protein [Thermoplasmata archaeon]
MKTVAERDVVIAKLEDGEDLLSSLELIAGNHRIEDGTVLWGIGMVRDFDIGYFDGKEYRRSTFPSPHELLALHGTVSLRGDPKFHLHLAAGNPEKHVVGGHLFKATVSTLNEICLTRFDSIRLNRAFNPRSGLRELVLE